MRELPPFDPDLIARVLENGETVTVTSVNQSMEPTLPIGAKVAVCAGSPTVGDVVLIRGYGTVILHRLIAKLALRGRGRWVHAGDAPGASGGLCRLHDVIGVTDLPRRVASPRRRAELIASAVVRAGLRRIARFA